MIRLELILATFLYHTVPILTCRCCSLSFIADGLSTTMKILLYYVAPVVGAVVIIVLIALICVCRR